MDAFGELAAWLGLVLGAGGIGALLFAAVRQTWIERTSATAAWQDGRMVTAAEYEERLAELRADFDREFQEMQAKHRLDIERLEQQLHRYARAVSRIVAMVSPDRVEEALAEIAELTLVATIADIPRRRDD